MNCQVCESKFSTQKRKKITCLHCNYESCTVCNKTYILSTPTEAKCMNCKFPWNRELLINYFSETFVKGPYKKHQEDLLFDRQLTYMEQTQREIEKDYKIMKIQNEIEENVNHKIIELHLQIAHLLNKKENMKQEIKNIQNNNNEIINYICPCPECNGFIRGDNFLCGLCNKPICEQCWEIKNSEDHECNPETVKTVKSIESESKPCPECKCSIYKISGCDQIFCTNCTAVFNWKTLDIIKNKRWVHNPHYFEWLENQTGGYIGGNNNCVGLSIIIDTQTFLNNMGIRANLSYTYRRINHIMEITMSEYRNFQIDEDKDCLWLRKEYLQGGSKDDFKIKLQRIYKHKEKIKEIYQILDMFVTIMDEMIAKLCTTVKNANYMKKYTEYTHEVDNLLKYTNDSLLKIKKLYHCRVINIDSNLGIMSI